MFDVQVLSFTWNLWDNLFFHVIQELMNSTFHIWNDNMDNTQRILQEETSKQNT